MSLFDWIDGKLFDIHWYFTEERELKKSQNQFVDTMDQAIEILNAIAAGTSDSEKESSEVLIEAECDV